MPPAFMLVSCSDYFSILKMEAICSSETSVENGSTLEKDTWKEVFLSNRGTIPEFA
jgi:hypothetical protein